MSRKNFTPTKTVQTPNISVLNLSNYNAPSIVETTGSNSYASFGQGNSWFKYLEDSYNGSVTNRSAINSIALMIYGKGIATVNDIAIQEVETLFKPKDLRLAIIDLKKLGQCTFQIAYDSKRTKIIKCDYFPVYTLAKGKMDEKGVIKEYYYSKEWGKDSYNIKTETIPAFGYGSGKKTEILYVQNYSGSMMYYSNVDYHASLPYCGIEEELANYHLNNIANAFSPSTFVAFNNGVPTPQEQLKIEQKILQKWGGTSNAGKIMLSFSDSAENAPVITSMQLNDAHSQYEFISSEAQQKIFVGHRITSPMLLGIKDNTGLGNNAEELKTAYQLFNATVIRPFQDLMTDALTLITDFNGYGCELYFESLSPIEFTEEGTTTTTDVAEVEKETGVEMSSKLEMLLAALAEDAPEGYEYFATEAIGDEPADLDYEALYNELSAIQNSEQDTPLYKIRYAYEVGTRRNPEGPTREFCKTMLNLASNGKVYRKEDILAMEKLGLNKAFGHEGKPYSIWLYAGGVNCHHIWSRKIFKKKRDADGKPLGGNAMQNTFPIGVKEARSQGAKIPKNSPDVAIAEINKPNKGAYPS